MQLLKMRKKFCWFSCVIILMSLCKGSIKVAANVALEGIFAFGDSFVDQGNNNVLWTTVAKCNFPPYGKDFNGGTPTGRCSNGRTPPDLIAEKLGIKYLVPAYLDSKLKPQNLLTGVSFASAGSGYDPLTNEIARVISLSDQLGQFKEYIGKLKGVVGEESGNKILSSSLYLVVAGSNDLMTTYFTTKIRRVHYNITSYVEFLVSSATTFSQEIYKLGARRIAVTGVPPVGCLPGQRTLGGGQLRRCIEEYNEAAQLLNSKLSPSLDSLTKTLPQSRVVYIDIYNPLLHLIQNPQNYGFEVSDKGCCGTGDVEAIILCNRFSGTCADDTKYIFWDSYHPTEKAYKLLVDQFFLKYITRFL